MKRLVSLLTLTLLTACGSGSAVPVVSHVNTLCTSTTRYHATDNQADAMKRDELLWGSLARWLFGFNKVRDAECLATPATTH